MGVYRYQDEALEEVTAEHLLSLFDFLWIHRHVLSRSEIISFSGASSV